MALSNIADWEDDKDKQAGAACGTACGASDKPAACGTVHYLSSCYLHDYIVNCTPLL